MLFLAKLCICQPKDIFLPKSNVNPVELTHLPTRETIASTKMSEKAAAHSFANPRNNHDPVHLLVREVWREVLEWRADDAAVREALRGGLRKELLGQGHHDLTDGRAVGREGIRNRVV